MAKTRAQRKAERRKREQRAAREAERSRDADSRAQERTQVPESPYEVEAELAEEGADLDELTGAPGDGPTPTAEAPAEALPEAPARKAPAPSRADVGVPEEEAPDRVSRRQRRREERDRAKRAKESEKRRRAPAEPQERQRGVVIGFLVSCWAELKRVQWPDRETLIQASAVTVLFIAVAAAYLGALDAAFNWVVQRVL
ncbi:MAG TPA: preprotein translocase subunit SecE [Solirubrobacterales bacterium]